MRTDRLRILWAALLVLLVAASDARAQRWTNHLDASIIREIVERDDELYIATNGGLVVYRVASGDFVRYDNVAGLPSNDLTCLVFDGDILYVGFTDVGIAKVAFDGGRLDVQRTLNEQIDGLSSNAVLSVAVRGDAVVYGTESGAGTIVNDFATARFFERDGLPSDVVNDVLAIGDNVLLATDEGVAVLDEFDLIRVPSGGPPDANVIGTDGTLVFIGTDDGVWTLDPSDSTWTAVGPSGWRFYSFHYDGNTMRAGSTRHFWEYQGGSSWTRVSLGDIYTTYRLNGGISEVRGLYARADDEIYVGTGEASKGGYLWRYDGSGLTNIVSNAPGGNDVRRLSVDIDGSVWASFFGYWVGKLAPDGEWVNYNGTIAESDSLSNQFANLTCLADLDGMKWFCTLSTPGSPRPLDVLDDKLDADYSNDEWRHLDIGDGGGDGLGSLRLQRALLDPAGNRWFLSDDSEEAAGWAGIHILSRDRSEWLQVKPGVAGVGMVAGDVSDVAFADEFAYIALKSEGVQIWRHNGYDWNNLSNLSDDTWGSVLIGPEDDDSEVSAVALEQDGVLWIGTNGGGLYRRAPGASELRRYAAFAGFGVGILSVNVNDLLLDRDDNLWVATSQGLNRISAENENDVDAWSTAAAYVTVLNQQQYPFEVISPLANAFVHSLALDPDDDVIYAGTAGGLSVFDYSEDEVGVTDLDAVYVYPNPLYGTLGHNALKIENISGPVNIEVYSLEGELVHSQSAVTPGQEVWDLTTATGFVTASGVYLVRISSPAGAVVKRVAVIR